MLNIDPIYTPFTSAETRKIFVDLFAPHEVEAVEALLKKSTSLPERSLSSISFSNFFEVLEAALFFRVKRLAPDWTFCEELVCDFLDTASRVWQNGEILGQGTRETVDYCLKELEHSYPEMIVCSLKEICILTIDEVTFRIQKILLDV